MVLLSTSCQKKISESEYNYRFGGSRSTELTEIVNQKDSLNIKLKFLSKCFTHLLSDTGFTNTVIRETAKNELDYDNKIHINKLDSIWLPNEPISAKMAVYLSGPDLAKFNAYNQSLVISGIMLKPMLSFHFQDTFGEFSNQNWNGTLISRTCAGQFNNTPTFETFYKVPPNTILSQNYGMQELYQNPILFLTYDFSIPLSEKGDWWNEEPMTSGPVQKHFCHRCLDCPAGWEMCNKTAVVNGTRCTPGANSGCSSDGCGCNQ